MSDSANKVYENVPSPFCGIASDDLKIEVQGDRLKVLENGDAVTISGFEAAVTDKSPRIGGQPASLEDAVAKAAALLKDAKLPLFSGFGTDVNGTRAAMSLIDKSRGVFDQMRAEGGMRNLAVLQDSGWLATTLGELKNRVEVLVCFGSDIEANFPRFFERFIWTPETLFGQDTKKREIVFIGPAPAGKAAVSPDGREPKVIPCPPEALPDVAAALAALARGNRLQAETVGGIPVAELQALVERMRQASYSVVTWAAGQLNFPHAELAIQQVCQFVVTLNKTVRAAALPVGGQDGDRTAGQVASWISGYPTRVGYLRGYPEHDAYHYSSAQLLGNGEADLLVWVNSIALTPPPASAIPTVAIGRSGMQFGKEPDVFIPVGCPGIDHGGHMYRCDNVVAMPLYKLRDAGLPSASDVLKAIEAAL
ncbi:formylmethanofuran dehydrogenase subunit B [Methylogaea oryzae]|uniref:Tungsten-containing formylmethanofuran dehydrogenase 2 subunit B n=1 Tax=Methylogaea oryzae TaxID=1295382 RepID=A0A8D5ALM4_9GAMM|nr:formylmethanofuran dehydrogenase subunit B [Methylogaea oryzae]BBL72286.1 tungsten-containing formylmethanofuran dehydrogenase 2 subunit B [Methylogaea oryzae]